MLGPYKKIRLENDSVSEVRIENDKLIIPILIPPVYPINNKYDIAEISIKGDLIRELVKDEEESPAEEFPEEESPGSKFYVCPKCKGELLHMNNTKYCGHCGQKLNWSKIVEEE